ncbi:MAG: tetratricopeptide repeat protein [Planctomycetota bacterium]|jgi:tetratricopeptide (TPR) repeat protein
MKRHPWIVWIGFGLLLPFTGLYAQEAKEGEEARIQTLIEQLGADSWSERATAAAALGRIGAPAFEALHRASRSAKDPEIRHRAKLILAKNLWRGLPSDLGRRFRGFFQKPAEERVATLQELGHVKTVLGADALRMYLERAFLYDDSPDVREVALDMMEEAGILLARQVLTTLADIRKDPWSRRLLGLALSRNGFHREALKVLPDPGGADLDLAFARTRSLHATGRAKDAVPFALTALKLGNDCDDPYFNPMIPALALLDAGETKKALDGFDWEANSIEWKLQLAVELDSRGNTKEAVTLIQSTPGAAEAILRTRLLARKGDAAGAVASLKNSIDRFGFDGPGVPEQLRALVVRGWKKEALDAMVIAGEPAPSPVYILERARILAELGRLVEAEALLFEDAFLEATTEDPAWIWGGAEILSDHGKPDKAIQLLQGAREMDPHDPGLIGRLAWLLESQGKKDDARRLFLETYNLLEDLEDHRRFGTRWLREASNAGQLEPLAAALEKSIAALARVWAEEMKDRQGWLPPSDEKRVPLLSLLGRLRGMQGRPREARRLLNQAWELRPHSLELAVLLDRIAVERGIRDVHAKRFFRILLTPAMGSVRPANEGIGETLCFLHFTWSFCDPRWEESEHSRALFTPTFRFFQGFWPLLPAPGVGPPLPPPAFPDFGRFLWDVSHGEWEVTNQPPLRAMVDREVLSALLEAEGDQAVPLLAAVADKGGAETRKGALALLDTLTPAKTAPFLLLMMKRGVGEFPWQQRVACSLARQPLDTVKADLERLMEAPSERIRSLTASIFLRRGEARYAEVLAAIARDPRAPLEARHFSAVSLAPLREAKYAPLFKALGRSADAALRMGGAIGLYYLQDPEGQALVARELRWLIERHSSMQSPAFEAAAIVGGDEVRAALLEGVQAPGFPREEALNALISMGGPGGKDWVKVLDSYPFGELGARSPLGSILDALALWGDAGACREGLLCLMEPFAPGTMEGVNLARAARLARRAGDEKAAERFFALARRSLAHRDGGEALESIVRLLSDFQKDPEEAVRMARRLKMRWGWTNRSVMLEARALAAGGKREEALALLDKKLRDIPRPGRPRLVRLRERIAGK